MPVAVGHNLEYSWMAFVDGENFTLRAQNVARTYNVELAEGTYYKKDCFVWFPGCFGTGRLATPGIAQIQSHALRAYYYTSLVGDSQNLESVKENLWKLGFAPQVFKKDAQKKAKGVDITLTKDMLAHAFRGDYEVAVLFAGDGDYVPLVEEVKRAGKLVHVFFFADGLNPSLKLAADWYKDLTESFVSTWKSGRGAWLPPGR